MFKTSNIKHVHYIITQNKKKMWMKPIRISMIHWVIFQFGVQNNSIHT